MTASHGQQAHSTAGRNRVAHPIAPLFDGDSRVLVLGTMPSPASRAAGFYYAHPQNRFWRVLAALFGESVPVGTPDRARMAHAHGIALWDVLASCDIAGASDASIANAAPNDLGPVLQAAPIERVFTTGAKARDLYLRFDAPLYPDLPLTPLPSTSAANARMGLADLIEAYRPLAAAARTTAGAQAGAGIPAAGLETRWKPERPGAPL